MGVQVPPSAPRAGFLQRLRILFLIVKVNLMIYLLTILHVVVCFLLIGIILLQPGTGADLAGAFGGQGSQTAFGPRGTVSILTKVTAWAAIVLALTSIVLTVMVTRGGTGQSVLHGVQSVPAQTGSRPTQPKK